jgi:hypothetical protein
MFEAASDNELIIGCGVRSVLAAPRSLFGFCFFLRDSSHREFFFL